MNCNEDKGRHETPTRRDYVKYGGAVIGGGLLAGCSGDSSDVTPTGTPTDSATETETSTPEDASYSVTMSPVGTVTFEQVPEKAIAWYKNVADMLVALGQQERLFALLTPGEFYTGFYDELPGVEFDTSEVRPLPWEFDKETLYELDADVHHIDPVAWQAGGRFDGADIKEIEQNVGPFFNNLFSCAHGYQGEQPYEYYTLWELLDKYAQVYQVQSRSQALKAVRDELVKSIQMELPSQEDRPTVALVHYNPDEETFGPYQLNGPGFGTAHTRPLGANDALPRGNSQVEGGNHSIEAMLKFDPDVMIHNFDWINIIERTEAFFDLADHPVAKEITAVKNDRLYAGGTAYQGPIYNIFQIELTAKQIYPGLFGEPPEPSGSVPEDEQLFDRQRVANIISGDF